MLAPTNHDLLDCLDRIDRLQVFPQAAMRILVVTQRPDAELTDLESAVSTDPVLSARILQVANSPLYGVRSRVGTLRRAVQMLGIEGTRGVAFALAVSALGAAGGPESGQLYRHAMATAATVQTLAPRVPGVHRGLMFATALVHNLGLQLLLILEPAASREMLFKLGHSQHLVMAERMHFGFDHAHLGAEGLRRWGLPEPAANLVATHHEPVARHQRPQALLQIADAIADGIVRQDQPWDIAEVARWHPLTPLLGLAEDTWDECIEEIPGIMGEIQG